MTICCLCFILRNIGDTQLNEAMALCNCPKNGSEGDKRLDTTVETVGVSMTKSRLPGETRLAISAHTIAAAAPRVGAVNCCHLSKATNLCLAIPNHFVHPQIVLFGKHSDAAIIVCTT